MMRSRARVGVGLWLSLVCAGCGGAPDDYESIGSSSQEVSAPLPSAFCSINVIGKGTKSMEKDYLPHVITCENGGANLEALKAQAIAARSVAYYAIKTSGSICDGQGCQVYGCGATPSAKAYAAVEATAGQYLSYAGMLTYGFYVAGSSNAAPPSCHGSGGVTEKYVTYNQGKTGTAVKQTSLGYIGPAGWGQNRGCMSQWGARCLENSMSYASTKILQFYYGADIKILQATGSCVVDNDKDNDGVADAKDNCPSTANSGQVDTDKDGKGDACEGDDDGDGIGDGNDNCPKKANATQTDTDKDGKGDACDPDNDNDKILDAEDNCVNVANSSQLDTDKDGKGDACDTDDDGDGVTDADGDGIDGVTDNCQLVANPEQADADADGTGDACDTDGDGDGVPDEADTCPDDAIPDQVDTDEDGLGDGCDEDDDGDGVSDDIDACPLEAGDDEGCPSESPGTGGMSGGAGGSSTGHGSEVVAADDSGGCALSASPARGTSWAALAGLFALLMTARRRRS